LKTRHKITLLFSLIVTAILLVVSLSVYYFTLLERRNIFYKRLSSRASNNAQIFSYDRDTTRRFLDRINMSTYELLPDKSVEIYNVRGEMIYQYRTQPAHVTGATHEVISQAIMNGQYSYEVSGGREALAVHYTEGGDGIVVVVAASDVDGWRQLQQLKQIFLISLLIGAGISLAAGHFFSKELLRPVARMIREVNEISSHSLSKRLKTGDTQDELNQLSATFNKLLDRLQEYFIAQRRFVSNASHELSTPLTSISSQLEVTLQRERSTDEYRQVMYSVQEDVVELSQLTKSLLEIAKTGSEGSIALNEVRIDEILFKTMGDIKKINAVYQVELDFNQTDEQENSFLVFGNADLLYIAIKNIVENGCKYSPDNTARINLSFGNGITAISVSSLGKQIIPEEHDRLFQPFYRSGDSNGTGGFGLGLALAQRIISLHKGEIKINWDEKSGNVFVVMLPSA
jgi:two-component system, OmpR family, sensor histidine kinase ArlS